MGARCTGETGRNCANVALANVSGQVKHSLALVCLLPHISVLVGMESKGQGFPSGSPLLVVGHCQAQCFDGELGCLHGWVCSADADHNLVVGYYWCELTWLSKDRLREKSVYIH